MIKLYTGFPLTKSLADTNDLFCHTRLSKDLQELRSSEKLSSNKSTVSYSDPVWMGYLYKMSFDIVVYEGVFKSIVFKFNVWINKDYPFKPPKVSCTNKTFHPNIDVDTGEVSLAMLKPSEWIPSLSLNFILFGLELLLIEPDLSFVPNNINNIRCADLFKNDIDEFCRVLEFMTERNQHILYIPNELEKINADLCRLKINPNAMECEAINNESISNSMPISRFDMISIEEEEETQKSKLLINPLKRTRNEENQPENSWLKQIKMP